jgi:hypothetical protein
LAPIRPEKPFRHTLGSTISAISVQQLVTDTVRTLGCCSHCCTILITTPSNNSSTSKLNTCLLTHDTRHISTLETQQTPRYVHSKRAARLMSASFLGLSSRFGDEVGEGWLTINYT